MTTGILAPLFTLYFERLLKMGSWGFFSCFFFVKGFLRISLFLVFVGPVWFCLALPPFLPPCAMNIFTEFLFSSCQGFCFSLVPFVRGKFFFSMVKAFQGNNIAHRKL